MALKRTSDFHLQHDWQSVKNIFRRINVEFRRMAEAIYALYGFESDMLLNKVIKPE
jgi:hypothetical protein